MAGRAPIKVYEYSPKGEYIGKFNTFVEARGKYFPTTKGKIPLLRLKVLGVPFGFTPEGNVLVKERLGRKEIVDILRIYNSPYCSENISSKQKIVQVFNLEGKLLLEARNQNVLNLLTNISQTTISTQLSSNSSAQKTSGLIIKYKEVHETNN